MHETDAPAIVVAVGILESDDGRILLCQRAAHKSFAGQWEFPGGKAEAGETPRRALVRELREELAIAVLEATEYHRETATYPGDHTYDVRYFRVRSWSGSIVAPEFADLRWVARGDLCSYDVLAGNLTVCRRLDAEAFDAPR